MSITVEPHAIICQDCGRDYETTRRNTKLCSLCRLSRDLRFIAGAIYECWACNTEFAPIARGDKACGACCHESLGPGKATCVYCGNTRYRVVRDVDVCHECARKPELRGTLLRAVTRKARDTEADPPAAPDHDAARPPVVMLRATAEGLYVDSDDGLVYSRHLAGFGRQDATGFRLTGREDSARRILIREGYEVKEAQPC